MAIKKIQIIPPGYTDILHPETDSSVVLMNDGVALSNYLLYAVTTGSANTYLVSSLTTYLDGTGITVKIHVDSTGASTLNGKPLKSANGTDITNLKANGIYTFRYNSSTGNFIMQGEGVDATSLITATNLILGM